MWIRPSLRTFNSKLGNVSETVQVTATTSALELSRDSYEVSHLVNTQDLQDLPSAARSFIAIASQGPGQAAATDVPAGPMITFGRDADEMIVGGQAVGSTTFLQDGVVNMNLLTGTANIVPSIESIQEVSVESNGMSARFTSPGLINVISKRGTNRIHGTAYDYFGNTVLNARNFFATTLAPQVYNEFGANLGAPILKNKLFAFFDYSGRRSNNPTTNRDRVPTAAELQGNVQGEATIYDPVTYSASAGTITAFPNNTIPTSRISNYATLFSPYFPAANIPLAGGVNYIANLNAPSNTDHYSGRLDYVLSSKDTLSGQIQMDFAPAKTSVVWPEYDLLGNIGGTNAYLQDIHIFTANVINIARMGYNRSIVIIGPLVEGTQNFVQAYGLQNLNLPADQSVPPTSTITGVNSFGYPQYPMGGKQNLFQWADEVNWTMGQHQFFFGAELQRMQFNGVWQAYNGGGYSFTGEFTSNHKAPLALGPGMADFLLGYPTTATGGQGVPEGAFRSSNVAGYIQDNWKLTRKLTLNLGVRYEFFNAPADKWGHDTIFNLPTSSYLHEPWTPDYTNFSPRAGFAYSLTRNTVIRSGFGIYYATEPYQFLNYMVESPQYYVLQSITENYLATPVPVTNAFSANPTSSALAITSVGSRMPTPYTEQWNIGVQQAFGPRLMATVSYVGSASHHQSERFDPNQAFQENPAQPTALATRRPFPAVGDVTEQLNIGNASYNSLQSTLQYRLRHGLSVQASYTFSKTLDLSDAGATTPVNSQDLHGSYGVANFGRAQVFNATYVYELPFGNNQRFLNNMGWFSKQVAGGWNISGITSKYTGIPFEIVDAAGLSSTGTGAHIQVPNRVC